MQQFWAKHLAACLIVPADRKDIVAAGRKPLSFNSTDGLLAQKVIKITTTTFKKSLNFERGRTRQLVHILCKVRSEFGENLLRVVVTHVFHKRLRVEFSDAYWCQTPKINVERDVRNRVWIGGIGTPQFSMRYKFDNRSARFTDKTSDRELSLKSAPLS